MHPRDNSNDDDGGGLNELHELRNEECEREEVGQAVTHIFFNNMLIPVGDILTWHWQDNECNYHFELLVWLKGSTNPLFGGYICYNYPDDQEEAKAKREHINNSLASICGELEEKGIKILRLGGLE